MREHLISFENDDMLCASRLSKFLQFALAKLAGYCWWISRHCYTVPKVFSVPFNILLCGTGWLLACHYRWLFTGPSQKSLYDGLVSRYDGSLLHVSLFFPHLNKLH